MTFRYCDALKEIVNDQVKLWNELNLTELDKMIHDFFPKVPFEMQYSAKQETDFSNNICFKLKVKSFQDMTTNTGIFEKVLSECRIESFNSNIEWDDKEGFQASFELGLYYEHFAGLLQGANAMNIAVMFFNNGHWEKHMCKEDYFN